MEWFKLFALVFAIAYIVRFVVALIIELFSEEPGKIKIPQLYELTLICIFISLIKFHSKPKLIQI